MSQTATQRVPVQIEGLNLTGATLPAFRAVKGSPSSIELPAADTDPIFGFLTKDCPDKEMGDVQVYGVAIAIAGAGGVTKGQRLTVEAATGKVLPWSAGKSIVGVCQLTAAADKTTEVLLCAGAI